MSEGNPDDQSYAPRWPLVHILPSSIAVTFGFPPISESWPMRKLEQKSVDAVFANGNARNVTVYRVDRRRWYFAFESDDKITGEVVQYAMVTARGDLRLWADPRNLFDFLSTRYGVQSVIVILSEPD